MDVYRNILDEKALLKYKQKLYKKRAKLGREIKRKREDLNIPQNEFASHFGITTGLLIDIEKGKSLCPGHTLVSMVKELGIDVDLIIVDSVPSK